MELVGVIGNPISHSLSPAMHNAAFSALGKKGVYIACLVAESQLEQAICGAAALGFTGLNVTVPFKEKVIPYLTKLTPAAQAAASVNTILFAGDARIGHSTDGEGFIQAAQAELGLDFSNMKILLVGAGGAARAIASQLLAFANELYLTNRTLSRAQHLAEEVGQNRGRQIEVVPSGGKSLEQLIGAADVIINTTSVGMGATKGQVPIPCERLHPGQTVIDIIYNPRESALLQQAKARGCRIQNGIGMLVWQAVKAWEFWWGQTPPPEILAQAVIASLP